MTKYTVRDKRGGNRYFIDNALLRGGWGKILRPAGIAVYNALCLHASVNSQEAWPGLKTMAELIGCSRSTVIRAIKTLVEFNLISSESRYKDNRQTSNLYTLLAMSQWKPPPGITVIPPPCQRDTLPMSERNTNNTHVTKPIEQDMPPKDTTVPAGGKDYLEELFGKQGSKENSNSTPRGWRAASDGELKICRRVALLWTDDKLPWSPDDIERSLAAAHQFLELHGGDARAAVRIIDEFHAAHGDDFTVTSAYSLRNAIPKFVNEANNQKVVKVRM